MKEFLRQLIDHDYDGINFYINDDDLDEVTAFEYADRGTKIKGNNMGDMYDIIITRPEPTEMPERFEAILTSPPHYIERMLRDGFVGIVGKVTTTSKEAMDAIYESICADVKDVLNNGD